MTLSVHRVGRDVKVSREVSPLSQGLTNGCGPRQDTGSFYHVRQVPFFSSQMCADVIGRLTLLGTDLCIVHAGVISSHTRFCRPHNAVIK
jgi:hypothetical protein